MEENIQISVVVPVYKVEKYLRECVDSVLAQTFTNFELILVDDGSPDNSGKICDEYAKKDPRVRVFHQENGGVSSARKLGVENARGEWISFVDADDMLLPDGLATLYRFADAETDLVEAQATATLTPPPILIKPQSQTTAHPRSTASNFVSACYKTISAPHFGGNSFGKNYFLEKS